MSMPGAYRPGGPDDFEVQLALTDTSGDEESTEDGIPEGLELIAAMDDDEEDDSDSEFDGDGNEDYTEDDEDDDDDIDIDADEDFDEDGNYIGDDPELVEAERLARAAEIGDNEDDDAIEGESGVTVAAGAGGAAAEDPPQYTLAIDPSTNRVYLVDGDGGHTELNMGDAESGNSPLSANDTLSILSRLLGRRSLRSSTATGTTAAGNQRARVAAAAAAAANDDGDDDEDGDEDATGMFRYGFRGGRRTARGLFPPPTEPVEEGVELARRGLFGKPGIRHQPRRSSRFAPCRGHINDTLRAREYSTPSGSSSYRFNMGDAAVPNSAGTEVAKYDANIYCGQYSQDGSFFYTCAQDYKIRIYDMQAPNTNKSVTDEEAAHTGRRHRQYRMYYDDDKSSLSLTKTIQAREHLSSWTITDANLSADNTKMIWSTIGPVVGMTKVRDTGSDLENYDDGDGQVALDFGAGRAGGRRHFGIWSVRFSADGSEIVAGAGSGAIYVYDLERRQTVLSIAAHEEDVNAVCFADTASSNVLVSGSDDNFLKVWDRRSLGDSGRHTRPSGHLVGHTEGITYVDPKGDGRFVISNSKDQTCKLWDLRMMYSDDAFSKLDRLDVSVRNFDYRHGLYRKPRFEKHPHDRSLMTYTGHTVLRTLIRCHFSPQATTGQQYIYSGSYDGRIHIWNLDGTVKQVLDRSHTMPLLTRGASTNAIKMNDPSAPDRPLGTYPSSGASPVVRDLSWSPYSPCIMSSAWTESGGSLAMHEWKGFGKRQQEA